MKMLDYVQLAHVRMGENLERSFELVSQLVDIFQSASFGALRIVASGSSRHAADCARDYLQDALQMQVSVDGCLRGLLADGVQVTEGFKCADVDPRGDASYINYISDKATSVGGGVLEALAMLTDVFRG